MMKKLFTVKSLVTLGIFSAIAYALMFVSRSLPPLIPAVPFLIYDPKDFVIVIVGFLFGPLAALLVTLVVSLLELITVSGTGIIGFVMNVLSTSFFVLPAAIIYRLKRTTAGAVIGLSAGVILMTGVMLLWNYLITPLYMTDMTDSEAITKMRETIAKMLLPAFLPFNLIKAGLNMAFALLTYKPIVTGLRRANVMPESSAGSNRKFSFWIPALGIVLLVSAVLVILIFNKVI